MFIVIIFKMLFIYFCLCWVFALRGIFFLVVASGGFSLVVVCELLIVLASFIAEQGLLNLQASVELGISSCGTWA